MFETYAGTGSGVVRLDGGVEALGLAGHRISALHALRDERGDQVILAGTYGEGLFRSADAGRTWAPVTGVTAPAARTIVPDPLRPGALLCGTEPARLFRSLDAGLTWAELDGVGALPGSGEWFLPYSPRAGALRNVHASPARPERVLAAGEVAGLLRSDDAGATWSVGPVGPNDDIHQVWGDPSDPDLLWTSLGWAALRSRRRGADAPALGGVARSRDGGATWQILHTRYTRSTIVPPARPDLVLSCPGSGVGAGGEIMVSADQGESWEPAGAGIEQPMPDMVEVFAPAPDGSVYAVCSRGRLLRSDAGEWRWSPALPAGQQENVVSVAFLER
jgi:photosystem II stability/assembly factor-like uncharacterized protein